MGALAFAFVRRRARERVRIDASRARDVTFDPVDRVIF
jgi:hypothetical protein